MPTVFGNLYASPVKCVVKFAHTLSVQPKDKHNHITVMKLHLPHKFQAALMAAIASVSVTSLSTGTAYAATSSLEDAELKLVDFTAETMTRVGREGWTLDVNGTDFTGDASGIYTSTSNIARIDSNHDWAGVANYGGNRTLWAGIITIDVNSLKNPAIAKASLIQDATGTNSSDRLEGVGFGTSNGQKYIDGAWTDDPLWGESNNMRIGTPLETYADANGLVTIAVIYVGDGTNSTRILVGDQTATGSGLRGTNNKPNLPIFLADAAGVKYTNVFLFGLENKDELSVATMQGMMKDASAYYWTGSTNGNWDAATTNWTHYGSSVAVAIGTSGGNANTNVVFGADATQKTVALAGATTVGALTVSGGDYTFNLNGNLTTSGITIAEGASLAYTGSGNITGTLAGAGTYVLAASQQALNSGLTIDPDWTGVVRISGTQPDNNGWNLATLDNIASTIEFAGVSTYFSDPGTNLAAPSKLTRDVIFTNAGSHDAAVYFNNGFSRNGGYEFSGKVSGSGTFHLDGSPTYHITFSGDVSDWDGLIKVTNAGSGNDGSWVRFSGNAQMVNVAINKTGGNFRVIANTDATFNKSIAVDKLEVTAGHTATLKETLTLTGDLTLDGSATLEKGGSVGVIDLSHGGAAHGTLTLKAGQMLTYSGSFWGANNNRLILEEGATVQKTSDAPVTIQGLAGESYVFSNANKQLSLNEAAFTLHNVQATINTTSNDVQLRFDNSKLVTSRNVTLKNAQNVFAGMDIQGGTTTVGANGMQLGAVTLSGGNLALGDGVTGTTSGVEVTGAGTISGGTLKMDENAVITIGSSGALTLSGVTVDLSAKELQGGDSGYVDTKGVRTKTGNGFAYTDGKVQLVNFDAGGTVTQGGDEHYMHGINSGSLVTTDGDDKGYVIFSDPNYTAYFMNVADTTENLSDIQTKAGLGFSAVYLNAGTLDTTGAEMLATMHVNSGEGTVYVTGDTASIITLDGSGRLSVDDGTNLNGTYLNIAADNTLTLEGGATITYSNISNLGTLDIGADTTVKSGTITVSQGGSFTTTGEGTLDISTLNITGGTAYLGSNAKVGRFELSKDGSSASTLEISAGATVEVTGTVTDSGGGLGSFMVSNWPASNVLNIEGTLIANSGISTRDGQADINVKNDGTLEMRAGLFKNTDRTKSININVKQGGTLIAAGHDGDYTTYGMSVNLEGGSTLAGYYAEGVDAIAINQTLTASGSLTVDAGGSGKTMTINTGLTGEGTSITKNGAGTLVLAGANTYGGATTVNAGILKTNHLGAGDTTVNGGTLDLSSATSAISTTGVLTLGNNSTLVFAGENMLTAGSLALGQEMTNLTFNLNSIVPTTAGTITLATGTTAASLENVNVEVVWTTLPTQYFEYGKVERNEAGTAWIITLTSKGKDLVWNGGTGIWSSSEPMWHTGTTEGLAFNSGDKATFAASGTPAEATLAEAVNAEKVTVEKGATVSLQPGEGEVSLTAAEMVVGGNLTTSADVNAIAVVASGTEGSWTVAGGTAEATNITAAVGTELALDVNSGTLTAETITANGIVSVAGVVNAGNVTGDGTVSVAGTLNAGKVTIATGESLTLGGTGTVNVGADRDAATLNGAGTLVIDDATVTVTGTNLNSFTGNIEVMSGGTLKLGQSSSTWTNTSSLGAYNKGDSTRTITIHEGGVIDMNGYADSCYVYTLDGGRFTNTGTGRDTGSTQTAGLILTANSYVGDSEHSSEFWLMDRGYAATKLVLGANDLTKQGSGVFGLYNTSVTGSGYLVVEAGTLKFNDSNSSSYAANFRLAGGNVSEGKVNLAANTTIDVTKDGAFSSVITGNGKSVTKTGDATLTLSTANTYSGGTIISAGKVVTTNATALGTGDVNIQNGATLEMQANLTIAGVLSGTGSISYNKATDGTLTLSKDKTNQTLALNIGSASGVGKLNLVLNGNSDYFFSGNVNVNNITQSASVTLFVEGTGSVAATAAVTTGRLVVGNLSDDSAAVFTLDGTNAQLGSDHTYSAVVQGYGTFQLVGGATQTLTGENKLANFHGTFAADGAGSVLTLNSDLASDVTFKATNGGEIVLAKAYTMGDNTAVDGGTVKVSNGLTVNGTVDLSKGTLTQTGGTIAVNQDKSLTLGNASITSAIANSGTVTFTKDITATGLEKASDDVSYLVGANDAAATDDNYFLGGTRTESTIRVVTGGGTLTPGGIKVTQGGVAYVLKDDGTAAGVTADSVDYTLFYQGQAGSTLNYSDIATTAAKHGAEMVSAIVGNQATLNVDQAVAAVMLDSGIVNINDDVVFNGYIAVIGGDGLDTQGNKVKGQIDTSKVGYAQNAPSSTTFTDAPVENGGVRFTSETGSIFGGVRVDANAATGENLDEYSIGNTRFAVGATKVEMTGANDAVIAHSVVVDKVYNSAENATGQLTLGKGAHAYYLKEVVATSGDVEFLNMAEANGTQEGKQTSVYLDKLEIGAGKTVSFYETTAPATPEELAKEAVVTVKNTLTAGTGATLNSDLVMQAGSVLNVSEAQESYGLTMGSSVFLKTGNLLGESDLTLLGGLEYGEYYYLFNDVEDLYINGEHVDKLDFQDWQHFDLDASQVYTNLDTQTYALVYNWTPINGSNVGTIAITIIPEPTTGTMSLLALAALAARRRRK